MVSVMNEDLPPTGSSRRAAASEKLAARRQRVRVIRRRVAGMSLATVLAASGAVLAQLVTGHDPALAHTNHAKTAVVASHSTGSSSAGSATGRTSSSSSQSGSAVATSPSAVTTSAS
jgi:hypothetical protein